MPADIKFELNQYHRNVSDSDLLADLKKVAQQLGANTIIRSQYNEYGKYHSATLEKRFGTWSKALVEAGLTIIVNRNITDYELFKNMEELWIGLGQQPLRNQVKKPFSKYSSSVYEKRFGTWRKALEAFIEFINSDIAKDQQSEEQELEVINITPIIKHITKRNISERLKVQVLMRDGNKCRLCGITVTGKDIHFDHIFPWSKGGETVLENIQVLCAAHNLAKGDWYEKQN